MTRPASVAVLGSLNIDLVASVAQLPSSGETVAATALTRYFGGKGANQAVAAARQGASVSMIGSVGGDSEGRLYRKRLETEGIDVHAVRRDTKALTGTALIGVDSVGENLIMVAPEANGKLTASWVRRHRRTIEQAHGLLIQFEVPREARVEAIQIAMAASVPVMVNPSPVDEDFPWGIVRVGTVIVNEREAERLTHLPPNRIKSQRRRWLAAMQDRAIDRLIITRGARSTLALIMESARLLEAPTLKVMPVDTVGAGDAFAGTLAGALSSKGVSLVEALAQANAAGALTTLKAGAQEAMPTRRALLKAIKASRASSS